MTTGTRLLMTQRSVALFLERAKIRVEGNRIVYDKAEGNEEKVFNIPYANLAVLFLGQGTSITQSAARLLAEEGVYVAFTGTGGTPLHYGSLTNYQVTEYMHRMYAISTSEAKSLDMAKRAMLKRVELSKMVAPKVRLSGGLNIDEGAMAKMLDKFGSVVPSMVSGEAILSNEGKLTKLLYKAHAETVGVEFTREHGVGDMKSKVGIINSRLDHGNYLAYGIAGAVLWTLGIPVSLSFLHGKTRAGGLVFDLADIFKDAVVLPIAFADHKSEGAFRACLIDALQDHETMRVCFDFMKSELQHA